MSNAQSGSLNFSDVRPPADGACPSGFHSEEPARVIDRSASGTLVPLTSMKSDAPPAIAGEAANVEIVKTQSRFMRPDINPDACGEYRKFDAG
jgi:hypothetical protein